MVEALGRSAAAARAVVADLEARARADLERTASRGPAGFVLDVSPLEAQPLELAAETIRQAAALLGEARPLRGPAQRALRRLLGESPRRRAVRLGGLVVERSGRRLRVGPVELPAVTTRAWSAAEALDMPEIGQRLTARVLARAADYVVPRESARAAFDADLLTGALTVRARRRGDVFAPYGASGLRRLKSFLIDAGVPRWQRPRTPLVLVGGDIVWVAGVRRGRRAPITATTTRVLELVLEPGGGVPDPAVR